MLKKRIYVKCRGEGKSQWLAEQIHRVAATSPNTLLYYYGSPMDYQRTTLRYNMMFGTKCPLKLIDSSGDIYRSKVALFTDELLKVGVWDVIPQLKIGLCDGDWYITMSAEDFV